MEKWALAVCHDEQKFEAVQEECLNYCIFIRMVNDSAGVVKELTIKKDFLLVIVFLDNQNFLDIIKIIRILTKAPVLILRREYDGMEKIAAIEAGADEYIQWPGTVQEVIASGCALIRRHTQLSQPDSRDSNTLSQGALFISADYRKVFVNAQEIVFPRLEFDLFYLLASNPGRVFTNEQIYREVWGEDYLHCIDNGLHSCLRRIRRKLKEVPDATCRIQNMRGVGYRFIQDNT